MEDEEATIEEYIQRINNNVAILERCDRDWSVLLSGLKEKTEKVMEHARVAEFTDGYIEVLMNAGGTIAHFKGRLKRMKCKFELKELSEQMVMFTPLVLNTSQFDQFMSTPISQVKVLQMVALIKTTVVVLRLIYQKYSYLVLMGTFNNGLNFGKCLVHRWTSKACQRCQSLLTLWVS